MKKLYLLALLAIFATRASATVTFTLVTGGCDTNKVLAINFTGGTGPYVVYWYTGDYQPQQTDTVLTPADTLFHYRGGLARVLFILQQDL